MRIVKPGNTKQFKDEAGDILILREQPYRSHIVEESKLQARALRENLDLLGLDLNSSLDQTISALQDKVDQKVASGEVDKKAIEKKKQDILPEVQLFRFKALCVEIQIMDPDEKKYISHNQAADLEEIYDHMHPEDRAWIDSKVNEVWEAGKPTEQEKN
jgi:hypothetical protein